MPPDKKDCKIIFGRYHIEEKVPSDGIEPSLPIEPLKETNSLYI